MVVDIVRITRQQQMLLEILREQELLRKQSILQEIPVPSGNASSNDQPIKLSEIWQFAHE